MQHLYGSLNPGLYIVLVAPYVSGLEGNFTCTLLSNYPTSFSSIWPPAWMITKKKDKKERDEAKENAKDEDASASVRKFIKDFFGSAAADEGDISSDEED